MATTLINRIEVLSLGNSSCNDLYLRSLGPDSFYSNPIGIFFVICRNAVIESPIYFIFLLKLA